MPACGQDYYLLVFKLILDQPFQVFRHLYIPSIIVRFPGDQLNFNCYCLLYQAINY